MTVGGLDTPDVTVDEDDLPAGSDHTKESLTVSDSFTISAPDGIFSVDVGNTTLTFAQLDALGEGGAGDTVTITDSPYGDLVLTGYTGDASGGEVFYSFTLDTTVDNDSQAGATGTEFDETYSVTVTDTDSDTNTPAGTLTVRIVDDVPVGIFAETVHLENVVNLEESFTLNFVAGADGIATVDFNFTEGDPAFDANGAQLKLNDEDLFLLFGDDTSVLIARTLASASVETTTAGTGSTNEVQTPSVDGGGGTYTLDFGAETTAAIAPDATAGEVETALEALTGISGVSVVLTVVDGSNVYTITFDNTGNVAPRSSMRRTWKATWRSPSTSTRRR